MHDMSNTRKEIAARLGFAARFGRDYPSKVSETAGASGGTWSKKMARYGSKKAAVMTYTDGGQVGQVYQDPDNPRVFKAFDMGGRLLGEGSEMDMKRKVEAINASRPGAKASFGRAEEVYRLLETIPSTYENAKKLKKFITEAFRLADITPAGKDLSLHDLASDIGQDIEVDRTRARYSRPGAKATMTREQTEEQKAGLKIMSAADPAVGAKIAKLIKEGKPQDQAVAIALDMKRRGEI